MFSTRNHLNRDATRRRAGAQLALALAAGAALAAGCARAPKPAPEPFSASPMVVDEAMQRRDWQPPQASYYENTSVVARPTGEKWEASWTMPARRHVWADPLVWSYNTITLPIRLIITPPWTPVAYRGETVLPTYTAQPPLE